MVSYARFKEESKDTDCNTPDVWDTDIYSKRCRNGYAKYIESLAGSSLAPATATPLLQVTSTTAAYISPAQKDDDAALKGSYF
jgi:hypothetical protein